MPGRRVLLVVADGVGCGEAPDADAYGDLGANTIGNLARKVGGLSLPNLGALGLGHVTSIAGVAPADRPGGAYGVAVETSAGKDTITGHWEMAGVVTSQALPTYPRGFPAEITARLEQASGRKLLGNKTASGTAIIEELGAEHVATGALILYTSADSVLQIAAHEQVVPIEELYRICEAARVIADEYAIGRVIARPFVGAPGTFRRTYNRRDFPLLAPEPTMCDVLTGAGVPVVGVGKISDIFGGRGITRSLHSEGNADGMRLALEELDQLERGLLFVNLVDFDMLYGHRNDAVGFAAALEAMDAWVADVQARLRSDDVAMLTADHGNDPTTPGTDHTRERVPLLAFGPSVQARPLGVRSSMCDIGQTVMQALGAPALSRGSSFWPEIGG